MFSSTTWKLVCISFLSIVPYRANSFQRVFVTSKFRYQRSLRHSTFSILHPMSTVAFSSPILSSNDINYSQFERTVSFRALKLPSKACSLCLKELGPYLSYVPKLKRVHEVPSEPDKRYILLSNEIDGELPAKVKDFLFTYDGVVVPQFTITLGFDHLSVDEILKQLLPEGIEIPSSFEQIGHIAHLNLREDALPYKHLIGRVIMEKNAPTIRTVVNKIGMIETEFRTFPMEVIAGEESYDVVVKESGARFSFSFRDVYWNSRLQMEHDRIISLILAQNLKNSKRIVADIMAGVGPFAVPLGMNRVECHANDLNPNSYQSLVKNIDTNGCSKFCHPYNMDGRQFVLELAKKDIAFTDALMNLPQNAVEFLDVFIGYAKRYSAEKQASLTACSLPRIYVYGFSTASDPVLDLFQRAADIMKTTVSELGYSQQQTNQPHDQSDHLRDSGVDSSNGSNQVGNEPLRSVNQKKRKFNHDLDNQALTKKSCDGQSSNGDHFPAAAPAAAAAASGYIVRDVSPKKVMVCLSFTLPYNVAMADPVVM